MTRLSDLSTQQVRMMAKLDDGFAHEDSVGQSAGARRGRKGKREHQRNCERKEPIHLL